MTEIAGATTSTHWKIYTSALEQMSALPRRIRLEYDTLAAALFQPTSNAGDLSLRRLSDVTDELPAINGYATGGVVLDRVTLRRSAPDPDDGGINETLLADDFSWRPIGGPIGPLAFIVVYDKTLKDFPLLTVCSFSPPIVAYASDMVFRVCLNPDKGLWTLRRVPLQSTEAAAARMYERTSAVRFGGT